MMGFSVRTVISLSLIVVGAGAVLSDDAKPSPPMDPLKPALEKIKAPEFAGYQFMYLLQAEVMKADDNKVTVRVFWQQAVNNGNGNRGRRSLSGGGVHHSPFATRRPNTTLKWEHKDYDLTYVAESLVRTKTLPQKLDANGKQGYYSAKEQDELKVPFSVPGYQASKSDLIPGTIIEAHLIRDKTLPANKVTDADVKIKYAVILRHDPNPPKDIAPAPSPAKKN